MTSELHRAKITCSHCGNVNIILASLLSPTSLVRCSNCHGDIGQWRDIEDESAAAGTNLSRSD